MNRIVPQALTNDNWWGYVEAWIYDAKVTWMEKTVASPFWTGLTLFSIGKRGGERRATKKHLLHEVQKLVLLIEVECFPRPGIGTTL